MQHGFTPTDNHKKSSSNKKDEDEQSLIRKASDLFGRVPILKALFIEILSGQGLATLLNVCFVTKLSESLPDDSQRAGWMGKVSKNNKEGYFSKSSYLTHLFYSFLRQ